MTPNGDAAGDPVRARRRALAGATIGNMVGLTPAVGAVFGLFLLPLAETFGWRRAAISGVLGLISVGPALVTPFAGRLVDRVGTRSVLIGGNLCFALSIAMLALTSSSLVQFYATFACVAVSAAFVSTPILAKVVSDWYEQNRGAALGFSAGFGNGLGSTLIPILAAAVMAQAGWRSAYVAVAIAVLLVGLPAYLTLVRDPPRAGPAALATLTDGDTLSEASRSPAFWLVVGAIAAAAGSMTAIFSHMVPILNERGIGVGISTMVLGIFALGTAAWQMLSGAVLDRVTRPQVIVPMYMASIAGILLLEWGRGIPMLVGAGCLLAIGLGTQFSALPYMLGRYFGLRHFGAIMGAAYSAVFVFQGLVPILLDHFYDVEKTYSTALAGISCCLGLGSVLLFLLPPYRYSAQNAPITFLHA